MDLDIEPIPTAPAAASEEEPAWRTHRCGDLEERDCGERMTLCGFVDAWREHKHQVFVHLRDGSGRLQVVFDGDRVPRLHQAASRLSPETVLQVSGRLSLRPEGTDRTSLDSKTIELLADSLRVIAVAPPLPFPLAAGEREKVDEALRLKHRYLELRTDEIREALHARAKLLSAIRRAFEGDGFLEVETPALTKQSPEGAREFLVPARVAPGSVYALAQSPQLYKQMLMVGGVERYYQVARCFRDEDGRANRQPEFTQLDLECSFATEKELRGFVERALSSAAAELGLSLPAPFPVIRWDDAMAKYGIDKPDLRFEIGLVEATDLVAATSFRKLRDSLRGGGRAGLFALPLPEGREPLTNAELDRVREEAMELGAPGLLWFRAAKDDGGPILHSDPFVERILSADERRALSARIAAPEGTAVFLLAAPGERLPTIFSSLRARLGLRYGLVRAGDLRPCWVVRFPFFEPGTTTPSHHPFTAPVDEERFRKSLEDALAAGTPSAEKLAELAAWPSRAFDLVINGEEIGSGSIRIHDAALQRLVFRLLGHDDAGIERRFGFFVRALSAGAPPHGGMAFGIDRLVGVLLSRTSLRDVVAFPKLGDGTDPLTGAPSEPPAGWRPI